MHLLIHLRRFDFPFFVGALLIFFPQGLHAQASSPDSMALWLSPLPLDQEDALPNLPLLDSVVKDYRFFFAGEEHHKQVNAELQLFFLRYLHRRGQVRNLIIEGGYSTGFLINQYLQTGEEGLLRKAVTNIPVCPEDQIDMYRRLYAFNQSLPPAERIRVFGIDLEHSPELALQLLHTLLPPMDSLLPPKQQDLADRIRNLHHSPYIYPREIKGFFKDMQKDLTQQPEGQQQLWGNHYPRIEMVVENVLAGYRFGIIKAMILERVWRRREEQMFRNFLSLQPELAPGGCFAQFGLLHTDLYGSPQWSFAPLAQRLDQAKESPVKGQVLTLSRYLRQYPDRYEVPGEQARIRALSEFAWKTYPHQVVLARIDQPRGVFPVLSRSYQYLLFLDPKREVNDCR